MYYWFIWTRGIEEVINYDFYPIIIGNIQEKAQKADFVLDISLKIG